MNMLRAVLSETSQVNVSKNTQREPFVPGKRFSSTENGNPSVKYEKLQWQKNLCGTFYSLETYHWKHERNQRVVKSNVW